MPENTPEEYEAKTHASKMYTCDELHRRGRTDLALSVAKAQKLDWKPSATPRHTPQTAALPFFDKAEPLSPKGKLETAPESVPVTVIPADTLGEMEEDGYDPFAES